LPVRFLADHQKVFKSGRDFLFMEKRFQRKILSTFAFSVVASIAMGIYRILLDLHFFRAKGPSLEGFVLTFVLVFLGLLILEKIFNLGKDKEILRIKERLAKLEEKK
jgi:hypothetical protein